MQRILLKPLALAGVPVAVAAMLFLTSSPVAAYPDCSSQLSAVTAANSAAGSTYNDLLSTLTTVDGLTTQLDNRLSIEAQDAAAFEAYADPSQAHGALGVFQSASEGASSLLSSLDSASSAIDAKDAAAESTMSAFVAANDAYLACLGQ